MIVAEILVLIGSGLTLLAAVGVVRFRDVFARMHALSKASALGIVLTLVGAAIGLADPNDVTSLLLAAALHLVTSPVGQNLIARATYFSEGISTGIDVVDELASG